MHPFVKKCLSLLTLALMIGGFQFIWFRNWGLTAIVVSAIVLHEVGHASVLWYYGISSNMFFVPFLGAAVVSDYRLREGLSDLKNALISLAGPAVNFAFIVLALALLVVPTNIEQKYIIALLGVNLSLLYWNLLPFSIFDGGRAVKELFDSMPEGKDRRVASAISFLAVVTGIALIVSGKMSFAYVLIMLGIHKKSREDSPADAYAQTAMSPQVANLLLVLYVIVLFGSMIGDFFVPGWIKLFGVWPAN